MTSLPPTRKDLRRKAIISMAYDAFVENGYAGTSMSAIAAALGGSKTTLWRYFPSKQALFMAVIDTLVAQYETALSELPAPEQDVQGTLAGCARLILRSLLTPHMIALMRMISGEAGRHPEIGAIFNERGLQKGWRLIEMFLAQFMASGHLRQADSRYAAQHFIALIQSGWYQRLMLGAQSTPGEAEIEDDIAMAVAAFLRGYGAVSGNGR